MNSYLLHTLGYDLILFYFVAQIALSLENFNYWELFQLTLCPFYITPHCVWGHILREVSFVCLFWGVFFFHSPGDQTQGALLLSCIPSPFSNFLKNLKQSPTKLPKLALEIFMPSTPRAGIQVCPATPGCILTFYLICCTSLLFDTITCSGLTLSNQPFPKKA